MNFIAAIAPKVPAPAAAPAYGRGASSSFTSMVHEFSDAPKEPGAADRVSPRGTERETERGANRGTSRGTNQGADRSAAVLPGTASIDLPARGHGVLLPQAPGTPAARTPVTLPAKTPGEPGGDAPPVPAGGADATDSAGSPTQGRSNSTKRDSAPPRASADPQVPVVSVPVALPLAPLPPLLSFIPQAPVQGGGRERARTETAPPDQASAERAISPDTVLQIRLRTQGETAAAGLPAAGLPALESAKNPPAPARSKEAVKEKTEQQAVQPASDTQEPSADQGSADSSRHPQTPSPAVDLHSPVITHQPASAEAPAAVNVSPPAAPVEAAARVAATPVRSLPETPAANGLAHLQEPIPDPKGAQQTTLRSVSLEFTPDGAGDVRLRLSERAGEVHISLHSQDGALSGRLHEGVHELVGSLSRAGYEAEAWTSGQGRQGQEQQPQEEERRSRHVPTNAEDGEDFSSIFKQPVQENS